MKKKLAALAGATLIAGALATPAATAGAWSCGKNPLSHCYGVAEYHEPAFDRFGLDLWTDCLHLDDPSGYFATHETWFVTAPTAWEAGYIKGFIPNIDNPTTWFRYFWGEYQRGVSGTYNGHFISLAQVSTWKNVTGHGQADGTWKIFLGGTQVGTTTYTYPYTGQVIQVGGESTDPLVYSHGKGRWLQTRDIATSTWDWATLDSIHDDWDDVYYTTASGTEMEQTSINNMCGSPPAAAKAELSPPPDEPLKAAGVRKQAVAFAKFNGDSAPKAIEAVETTRKAVKGNAGVADNRPVVTIQMKGEFTGNLASLPAGEKPLKGDTLTVTLDKATGEITDWSIGSERQDLAKLGSVKRL